MFSGTTTQAATSVATPDELSGIIDIQFKDGELAYAASNDTYYRINRSDSSGIPTASNYGSWTVFNPGGATGTRPTPPAGSTHNWNFDQAAAPTPGTVPDTIGTSELLLTASGGVLGTDFLVQQPRPSQSAKGTRFVIANGPYTFPLTKLGSATLAPPDNGNNGYTIGGFVFVDTVGTLNVDAELFGAFSSVTHDGFSIALSKGVLTLQVTSNGVSYSSRNFQGPGFEQSPCTLAIEFDANGLVEVNEIGATFTNGSNLVTTTAPFPTFKPGDFIRNAADPTSSYAQIATIVGDNIVLVSPWGGASSVAAPFVYTASPANARLYVNGEFAASVPVANGNIGAIDTVGVALPGWIGNLFTVQRDLTVSELLTYTTGYLGF